MATHQGKLFIAFVFSWVVLVLYVAIPPSHTASTPDFNHASSLPAVGNNATEPLASLHFLVPASKPDANLCKVLVSAGNLGYPTPVIINWNQTYEDSKFVGGGSHLAKIRGVHDYLQGLSTLQDDDLVLVVDGYDIWLQLRPQTLIDRYFDINVRADKRIANELGASAAKNNIRQDIVFGTQKRCWPWTEIDPPCYAVPFSTLREDVYGPQTDTDIGFEPNPFIKFRPRYLNSGIVIGTARAMRNMFERAMFLLMKEPNFGSDQFIFSHILGDQEIWREIVRRDERSEQATIEESNADHQPLHPWNEDHVAKVREKAASWPAGNLEFGIGLDYEMSIGINTVFSEDDTAWLHWNDEATLQEAESRVGIPQSHVHMKHLSQDITSTLPPFQTTHHDPKLPPSTNWTEVSLFTNIWTGIVPAIIHHNAHRDGRKALRETWWDQIWFANYTRWMYDAYIWEPTVAVAFSGYDKSNAQEYWPSERRKGGGRDGLKLDRPSDIDSWIQFDDICREYHEEVFRDGRGPWRLPVPH